jgi:Raf kinase inhibitor-like YbhB/YbcL family protein
LKNASALLIGILACGSSFAADPAAAPTAVFTLHSSGFEDNGHLARKYAGNDKSNPNCVGENISPALTWSHAPAGTKSFALMLVDPEGRSGLTVVHWVAYGIAATVTGFSEGEVSKPSSKYIGGKGTRGKDTYIGPCTPPGDWHHYTFTLIATDLEPAAFKPGMTRDELLTQLDGHALGAAGLIGRFRHD